MGYSLGIDLGTTFTAAAVVRDERAEVVALGNHAATIPSMVFLRDDDNMLIGDAAERRGVQEPARLAREFKRRLGDSVPIMLDRTPFSAERLMAVMLRQIVADVTQRQGSAPDRVAVTHPANWGPYKIDLLRQAVELAGIADATLVTEPVAAAVQYASTERVDIGDVVAVYDLGGGTFDAAVLRKTADSFETLGRPQGIERLGGIDFDDAVLAHVRRTVGDVIAQLDPNDPANRAALARLRQECVSAKETLSSDSDATVPVLLQNVQTQVRITRAEFEDMIRPTLRETIDSARRAIESAGVQLTDVKAVLLAGGSSRIPLVNEMVRAELGRPVVTDSHPKHAVALGAARLAHLRAGGSAVLQAPVVAPTMVPPPPPAAAAPVGSVAAGVARAAAASGMGATPPTTPMAATTVAPVAPPTNDKRSPWVIFGSAAAVIIALVVGLVIASSQGGDDTTATDASVTTSSLSSATTLPSTETTTQTTTGVTTGVTTDTVAGETTTPTTAPQQACEDESQMCVGIISAEWGDDSTLHVQYNTFNFVPTNSGTDGDFHVHFFWSSVPADEAGLPTGDGRWIVWDLADGGGQYVFDGFDITNIDAFGYQWEDDLCIAIATHDHQLAGPLTAAGIGTYYCLPNTPTPSAG